MALATTDEVRTFGRLPDATKLVDDDIIPQLDAAARELASWLGAYETTDDVAKQDACIEAECCICVAYLLPVLNTFHTQESTVMQRQIGDTDFLFHGPEDIGTYQEYYMDRARHRVAQYMAATGGGFCMYKAV